MSHKIYWCLDRMMAEEKLCQKCETTKPIERLNTSHKGMQN